MAAEQQDPVVAGHAFLSYVREDSAQVDRLQRVLQEAGIPVWRDKSELWPGEDWQAKIREAITDDTLAFIACFSGNSRARVKSFQNEELVLAVEQLRLRWPGQPWLIPVRFDDAEIPDRDLGGGRRLASLQWVDLFGDAFDDGAARLVAVIRRILRPTSASQPRTGPWSRDEALRARGRAAGPGHAEGIALTGALDQDRSAASSKLPEPLMNTLNSGNLDLRIGAVHTVAEWLRDPVMAPAAELALRDVAEMT